MTRVILYTDGVARGNPGPAAIGIVLTDARGNVVQEVGQLVGRTTNNEAEYLALLHSLTLAAEHGTENEVRTDSELMARQLKRTYRAKASNLKPMFDQAQRALAGFMRATIVTVPRELNHRADALANAALDRRANDNHPRSCT
jgi:ribonuclease HI